MKKILILCLVSLFLVTGCGKDTELEKYKEESKDALTFNYMTRCTKSFTVTDDVEDKITYASFSAGVHYGTLDDDNYLSIIHISYDFENLEDAKAYRENHKSEYEDWDLELEENIDDGTASISLSNSIEPEEIARDYINGLKDEGFECETTDLKN